MRSCHASLTVTRAPGESAASDCACSSSRRRACTRLLAPAKTLEKIVVNTSYVIELGLCQPGVVVCPLDQIQGCFGIHVDKRRYTPIVGLGIGDHILEEEHADIHMAQDVDGMFDVTDVR